MLATSPPPSGAAFAWDYLADDPLAVLRATASRSSWEPAGLGWDTGDAAAAERAGAMLRAWPCGGLSADDATATTRWCLSQFLHGEQAALLGAGRLVELIPQLEAKRFASAIAGEESRHMESLARYLEVRFGRIDPLAGPSAAVFGELLSDDRWDVVLAGSQIVVEGVAAAACELIRSVDGDPLLTRILRRIDADERRHNAFARLVLPRLLGGLSDRALLEHLDAIALLVEGLRAAMTDGMAAATVDHVVATGVLPGLESVGLLDAADGWLRDRLAGGGS